MARFAGDATPTIAFAYKLSLQHGCQSGLLSASGYSQIFKKEISRSIFHPFSLFSLHRTSQAPPNPDLLIIRITRRRPENVVSISRISCYISGKSGHALSAKCDCMYRINRISRMKRMVMLNPLSFFTFFTAYFFHFLLFHFIAAPTAPPRYRSRVKASQDGLGNGASCRIQTCPLHPSYPAHVC